MMLLTEPMMYALWPNARPGVVQGVMSSLAAFDEFGVNTPLRLAHFMAQISHECDGGEIIRENMNYNAARMFEIFGVGHHSARVTREEAAQLAHHPVEIAERVYGTGNPKKAKELGNTQKGDGYKYRGNGMLQLTGKASHAEVGERIGMDLVGHPEMLENPATSLRCALAEFHVLKGPEAADADDIELVTRRVNGGLNGFAERKVWFRKWKVAIDKEESVPHTAPVTEINESIQADKMPRGAETKGPPVSPEGAGTGAGGTVIGYSWLQQIVNQLQEAKASLSAISTVKYVQYAMIGIGAACLVLTIYGIVKNRVNARRV
jgi:putative chitinase